ncbi:MAG: ASKHA domain-containing protein [Candidatus Acidulodesulfobacterium sp.]
MKYSLGIDLGTTTVAAVLTDETKKVYPYKSMTNLQYYEFGLDSVKRIQNGLDKKSASKLQAKAVATINNLIDSFKSEIGFEYEDIKEIVIAGNTVMEMAFCGYPLISLSKPPYKPSSEIFFPDNTDYISELKIKNKEMFIFPVLDGFVGGDTVASIYYLDMINRAKPAFIADFGTNVEIALGCRDKIYTTSAPAGPAFEGGNIKFGMTASSEGAISELNLENGIFKINTVSGSHPSGICGSGIMSLVYELLKEGIIDENGRILPPEDIDSENFTVVRKNEEKSGNEIIVYFDGKNGIKFFQEDLRQFQFAKSAVKSASEILLEKFKIFNYTDFDVFISGTFGSRIKTDIIDLIDIFPFKGKNIKAIESSVLDGCLKYILSDRIEREADIKNIIKKTKNFPLSGSGIFQKYFIKNLIFQHSRL